MTPMEWIISATEGVASVALVAALVVALARGGCVPAGPRSLMIALLAAVSMALIGSFLAWTGMAPEGDLVQNVVSPLIPVLWLFFFVVELERADRQRLRREYDRLRAVHNLASHLSVSLEPQAVMDSVVEMAARLLNAPLAIICIPDEAMRQLTIQASYGMSPEEVHGLQFEREQDTPMWRALLERKPYILAPTRPGIHPTAQALFRRYGVTSVLDMPLVFSGEVIGVVGVAQRGGPTFGDDDVALLETLSAYAGVALHNARLYKRIAESEARYRVLVENAQVAIVVVDPTRHITFWNRGAERLFGWTAQEALRRHIELIYPEEEQPGIPREVQRRLDRDGYWFGEYAAIRKGGSRFTAFSSITRIVDPSGQVLGSLGILLDASEQVRLREQLLQAQKMETIGALAGGVAHDFNNLLTGILGFASLVKAGLNPDDEDYKAAAQIEEAAERGTQLVRQLLTFSQKQPVAAQPVRLNKVIEEAIALLSRTLPRIITLVTRLDPNLHIIQADPTQMHQIIMNLAVNARDAMPKGGSLTLTTENIYLTAEEAQPLGLEAGLHVRLTVSDTGAGMPPEVRRHVFEPFFTTKPKGTGLGLSTVYAIVTRHRGHVICTSEPGRGTTFGVTFPAVAQAADPHPPAIRE